MPGSKDQETEATTMVIEETMMVHDLVTRVEESAITLTNLKEEVTSRAGSSRTRSSFTMTMGSIKSQLGHRTRVVAVTMSSQQARPGVPRN